MIPGNPNDRRNIERSKAMTELIAELEKAKHNVSWLLDHANGLVDMHGLTYWAKRVEALRAEIKESL